jgi:hypothetical protein
MLSFDSLVTGAGKIEGLLQTPPTDLASVMSLKTKLIGPAKAASSVYSEDFQKLLAESGFKEKFDEKQEAVSKNMSNVKTYDFDYRQNKYLILTKSGMRAVPAQTVFYFLDQMGIKKDSRGYWLLVSHCFRPEIFDILQLSQLK